MYFRRSDVLDQFKELPEDLAHRVGIHLSQLRRDKGKQPSRQEAYDYVKDKPDCKGVTAKLVRQWIDDNWPDGKQGKRRRDPE
jgi:hypothetical protein